MLITAMEGLVWAELIISNFNQQKEKRISA